MQRVNFVSDIEWEVISWFTASVPIQAIKKQAIKLSLVNLPYPVIYLCFGGFPMETSSD